MSTSDNYVSLSAAEAVLEGARLADAWKHPDIPRLQWDAIAAERQTIADDRYMQIPPFRAFIDACLWLDIEGGFRSYRQDVALLDVGASSGYYYRLLRRAGFMWHYTACDYSPAYKEFAAQVIPEIDFVVDDARTLAALPDRGFDIVVSGCVMIHVPDWQSVIRPSARVCRRYIVFHRTPLLRVHDTTYWRKTAYGVPCVEVWINQDEFAAELARHDLREVYRAPVFENGDLGGFGHYEVVCEVVQ